MNLKVTDLFPGDPKREVDVDEPWQVAETDKNRLTIRYKGRKQNKGLVIELQLPSEEAYLQKVKQYAGAQQALMNLVLDHDQQTNKGINEFLASSEVLETFEPEVFVRDSEKSDEDESGEERQEKLYDKYQAGLVSGVI